MSRTRQEQGDLFGGGAKPLSTVAEVSPRIAPTPLVSPPPARPMASPGVVVSPAPVEPARTAPVPVLTVGELTQRIQGALQSRFSRVLVRGEISGFRGPNPRGHLYFSLKDADACLDVCIWASQASKLRFKLKDGLTVVAEGSVDVYAPRGRYSLICNRLEPEGEGALALAFQQLRERLTQEGLMGENRSRAPRALPFLPRRIGVVTSRSGAALQDFLRVLHTRNPRLQVLVADARVQGEGAAHEVTRALERLYRTDVDVIVVTRGGGSLEDLWTFNEEQVARAIHASPVPIVSAIGHEVDFTIADFVADHRAPTPSAAAERLAPVLSELELALHSIRVRLRRGVERRVMEQRAELARAHRRLEDPRRKLSHERHALSDRSDALMQHLRARLRSERELLTTLREHLHRQQPQTQLRVQRQRLQRLGERLAQAARNALTQAREPLQQARVALAQHSPVTSVQRHRQQLVWMAERLPGLSRQRMQRSRTDLRGLAGRLEAMSPLAVLARGYSVTRREPDGRVVRGVADVSVGQRLRIDVAEGTVEAQVTALQSKPEPSRLK